MLHASMLVIGDEILGGYVRDTNSPWLAQRLREHGVALQRIHTVPDTHEAIGEALRAELARQRPRLVVTSGGVGSTPDDLTFEAVAAALGRDVIEAPFIRDRLEQALAWQADQGIAVTDELRWHMLRMARVPAGGRLLDESSWVPGIRVDVDGGSDHEGARGASVVILPGIPSEFRRITDAVVVPGMVAGRNPVPAVTEIEHGFPESALNPCFAALERDHPGVKLGSYPGDPMLVRLTGPADEVAAAEQLVRDYVDDLGATPGGARLTAAWTARTRKDATS
jgi:molybdenum cofactor synthesis domain-containing protein